jgi:hypothetical protein
MQKKILRVLLFYIFFITACGIAIAKPTPTPDQMDKSPFTGIPCAGPCWYGLELGKSNENDVISIIPTLTFIDQNSVIYHRMESMSTYEDLRTFGEGEIILANCVNTEEQCLTIQVVKNILTEVSVVLNYQIKVDEAIKYLGNPNYIGFDRAGGERIACRVYLIWSEKQLVLTSKIFEGVSAAEKNCFIVRETGRISPSILVSEVKYMSPAAIDLLQTSSASEFFSFR